MEGKRNPRASAVRAPLVQEEEKKAPALVRDGYASEGDEPIAFEISATAPVRAHDGEISMRSIAPASGAPASGFAVPPRVVRAPRRLVRATTLRRRPAGAFEVTTHFVGVGALEHVNARVSRTRDIALLVGACAFAPLREGNGHLVERVTAIKVLGTRFSFVRMFGGASLRWKVKKGGRVLSAISHSQVPSVLRWIDDQVVLGVPVTDACIARYLRVIAF